MPPEAVVKGWGYPFDRTQFPKLFTLAETAGDFSVTINAFHKQLSASQISVGASWQKADFHIHEPGSSDYEYKGTDAASELGRAIKEGGYRFAVILKHQEFPTRDELTALQKHCPETTLIPGAEINVFVEALF